MDRLTLPRSLSGYVATPFRGHCEKSIRMEVKHIVGTYPWSLPESVSHWVE